MNKWMPIAFLLILVTSVVLRVPKLAERPLHHDEANQAYRFGILLEEGSYEYDADDHHGPTLYYLTLPIAWLTGVSTFAESSEITYRALPVIFGLLLILTIPMLRSGIGCIAVLGAALFTAISPAMAYYSRFYIQEMLLVFFTLLTIAAGWLSINNCSRRWAIVCGVAAGLMFATKETAIISYAALFGAFVLSALLRRSDPPIELPDAIPGNGNVAPTPYARLLLIAALCAVVVSFVLFSSFFTNLNGPLESILAYKGYFARGSGVDTEHVHPWFFYLRMLTIYRFEDSLTWSEGIAFPLGIIGCIFIVRRKIPANCNLGLARFLMFYTLLLTAAYSVISYKTPWCILSFLHGWILLAGIGVASSIEIANKGRNPRLQTAIVTVFICVLAFDAFQIAHRTVYRYAADYRNPYVYAHTAPDFKNLKQRINDLAAISPKGNNMYIQVIADPDETWPLPFYLRQFPNVGYWVDAGSVPTTPKPDLIISAPEFETDENEFLGEFYGLRADTLLAIHIDSNLWKAFLESRE